MLPCSETKDSPLLWRCGAGTALRILPDGAPQACSRSWYKQGSPGKLHTEAKAEITLLDPTGNQERGDLCLAADLVQLLELIQHNYRCTSVIPDQRPEIHQRGGERQLGDDDSLLLGVGLQKR